MSRRTTAKFSIKALVLALGVTATALSYAGQAGPQPGLSGDYFNDTGGNHLVAPPVLTRIDATVDFDFGNAAPDMAVTADNFSVRWTGFILPEETGNFLFQTRSDDGVRLTINGVRVIDNFTDHGPTNDTSPAVALTANQPATVLLEFYEAGGGAEIRLRWLPPSMQTVPLPPDFPAIPTANLVSGATVADPQTVTIDEDMSTLIILTGASGTQNQLVFAIVTPPANGTAILNGAEVLYTPNAEFSGTDSFTFSVSDGFFTATAVVTINVNPIDDGPPVAVDDSATTNEGVPIQIDILANDTAVDAPLAVTITSAPANGTVTLSVNNVATYTPAAGFFGTNSFTYQIVDVDGQIATATVTITVASIPPLITSPLSVQAIAGVPFTYTITATGTLPIAFTVSALPPGLTFNGTTISGVPTSSGSFAITLTATGPEASDIKTLVFGTLILMPNVDTDGDGITDEIEVAFGSNATDALSTPFGLTTAGNPPPYDGVPFHIQNPKANVTLNFGSPNSDRIILAGTLPIPLGKTTAGNQFGIAFGGVVVTGFLDLRGKAVVKTKTSEAKASIGAARANRKGTNARFSLKYKGPAAAALADEGLTSAATDGKYLKVSATVILVQSKLLFDTDVNVLYKSTGQKGTAKAIKADKLPQQP